MNEEGAVRGGGGEPRESPRAPERRNVPALLVLLLALAALLFASALIFLPFATPIALALVAATTAYPLFQRVGRLVGERRRGLASSLTCLLLVLLVFAPLAWVGGSLVAQVKPAVEWAGQNLDVLRSRVDQSWIGRQEWFRSVSSRIKELLASVERAPGAGADGPNVPASGEPGAKAAERPAWIASLAGRVTGALAGILGHALHAFFQSVVMLFLLFFFLKDGPQILQSFQRAIPLEKAEQDRVIQTFREVSRSILRGSFGTALAQGIVATVAFAVLGLPALFWGGVATICSLVPPFGTGLVTVPMIVFFAIGGHWGKGIFLAIVALLIGTLDNVVRTRLMRGGLRVHPMWILLSILGALRLFGPAGILYGPMILALLGTMVALLLEGEKAGDAGSERAALAPSPTKAS